MVNILITGKNSYIGNSFENWVSDDSQFNISKISLRNNQVDTVDFSNFDVVLHVAGLAHVATKNADEDDYFKINRDLAIEVAEHSKQAGVKQFIYLSSMIVYGEKFGIDSETVITRDSALNPIDVYGRSKAQADVAIQKLTDDSFKTAIVRIPMVYGPNSKGNFTKLIKIAKFNGFYPKITNKRSMIFIDTLSDFFKELMLRGEAGIFFPQNKDYVNTSEVLRTTRKLSGKNTHFFKGLNWIFVMISKRKRIVNKIYGSKIYANDTRTTFEYRQYAFEETIKKTIKGV